MAKFSVAPHTNHLLTYLLCIFSYLKAQDRSRVVFDHHENQDWSHRMFADLSRIFVNGSPIKW
jgi:hypothetical protein